MKSLHHIKRLYEFIAAEPDVAPTPTRPATPTKPSTPPRPWMPTTEPKPGTESKPMAELDNILDLFFSELVQIKDTPKGKKMIKKLRSKYGKN